MRKNYVSGPPWFSSYEKNNYGDLFYSLIRIYKPNTVIELGTKAGYSAFHMARGLSENGKGRLYCYDLWEKYPYRSVTQKAAEKNLKKYKKLIKFKFADAKDVYKLHKSVDILHVDLSNDGEILEEVLPHWLGKVKQLIIIEGGSPQRDKLEWMVKYQKVPIQTWLKKFSGKNSLEYVTFEPFPSVALIFP